MLSLLRMSKTLLVYLWNKHKQQIPHSGRGLWNRTGGSRIKIQGSNSMTVAAKALSKTQWHTVAHYVKKWSIHSYAFRTLCNSTHVVGNWNEVDNVDINACGVATSAYSVKMYDNGTQVVLENEKHAFGAATSQARVIWFKTDAQAHAVILHFTWCIWV